VKIRGAGDLAAFDVLTTLPDLGAPITGLRVTMHPVPEYALGGWGSGPSTPAAAANAKKKAAPAELENTRKSWSPWAAAFSAGV